MRKNDYDPVWAEATRVAARRRQELAQRKAQSKAAKNAPKTRRKACVKCGSPCRRTMCQPCARKWWAEKQEAAAIDREFREIAG